jgi:hypothetical protein
MRTRRTIGGLITVAVLAAIIGILTPATAGASLAAQTITFSNPGAQNFGTSPTLSAEASSGLAIVWDSYTPNVCTISAAGELTFITAGT